MEGARVACLYTFGCPELRGNPEAEEAVLKFIREPNPENLPRIRTILEGLEPFVAYQIIAAANGIEDPLSEEVVRAYWLGNDLLKIVTDDILARVLSERFHSRDLLVAHKVRGRKPHHNLNVAWLVSIVQQSVPQKLPHIISGASDCLVVPGRVIAGKEETIRVLASSIFVRGDQLLLVATPRKVKRGFVEEINNGDLVSIHLDMAREVIREETAESLMAVTHESFQILQRGRV